MADMTLGEAVLILKGDIKDLEAKLGLAKEKVNSTVQKISDRMKSVGKSMTVMGGAITGVSGLLIKSGMDAVESENLFTVSMGKMADSAREWSEGLRKDLGLNSYEVRKSVGTFNVMLTSMGQSEEAAFDMAKGLTQLSYDMASFYNLKPDEAFQKLQSGISGEVEPLKALGIVISDAAVQAYALEKGIGAAGNANEETRRKVEIANIRYKEGVIALQKSKKSAYEKQLAMEKMNLAYQNTIEKLGEQKVELSDSEKVAARYGLIMERTALAQGDMARTLDSPTNKLRVMQSQMAQISTDIGITMLPAFSALLDRLQPIITSISNWVLKNPDLTATIAVLVAGLGVFNFTLGPVVMTIGTLLGVLAKWKIASGAAALATKGVGDAAAAAVPLIGGGKGGLAFAIGSKSVGLFGALGLIAGAGAIGWAFGTMLYNWTEEGGKARAVLDSLGGGIYDLWEKLGGGPKSVGVTDKWKPPVANFQGQRDAQNQAVLGRMAQGREAEQIGIAVKDHFGVFGAIGKGIAQRAMDAFATGGISRGGLALVGERGPELVNLPAHSRVTPAHETRSAAGGVSINVNMGGVTVRENADINRIAQELGRRIDSRMIARGLRPITI